jgi:hypothetical protein
VVEDRGQHFRTVTHRMRIKELETWLNSLS